MDVAIQLGDAPVRPGDLVFGNADGLVIVEHDRIDDVYQAAAGRRRKELEIITKLREGRTTMELLGLEEPPE